MQQCFQIFTLKVVFGLASSLRMGGILLGSPLSGAVIWLAGVRFIFVTAGIFFLILVPMHLVARRLVKPVSGEG